MTRQPRRTALVDRGLDAHRAERNSPLVDSGRATGLLRARRFSGQTTRWQGRVEYEGKPSRLAGRSNHVSQVGLISRRVEHGRPGGSGRDGTLAGSGIAGRDESSFRRGATAEIDG